MHEPRGKTSLTLAYSVSPTGADHMEAIHDPSWEGLGVIDNGLTEVGLIEPVDRLDMSPAKARAFFVSQSLWGLYNSVGMCDFVGMPIGAFKLRPLADYINAATGWDMTEYELMQVGEKSNVMSRLFNLREGFTRADDNLPERMFEPLENGKLEGVAVDRDEFDKLLSMYYAIAGWDQDGVPTIGKLAEMDLLWAAEKATA